MKKILSFLKYIEDYLASALLIVMCLAITAQIIGRMIIKQPLLYTEELARFSYVWCVYLAIAMGEKYEDHFSVNIFVLFLKGKADKILYIFEKILGCVMFAVMFYWSYKFWKFERIIESPAFGISMSIVAASMVVGFFLSFVRRGALLIEAIKNLNKIDISSPILIEKE